MCQIISKTTVEAIHHRHQRADLIYGFVGPSYMQNAAAR
jgi:hypothetical protein